MDWSGDQNANQAVKPTELQELYVEALAQSPTSVEDECGAKGGVFRRQHHIASILSSTGIGRLGFGRDLFDVGSRCRDQIDPDVDPRWLERARARQILNNVLPALEQVIRGSRDNAG
jgi:hypothetical protein